HERLQERATWLLPHCQCRSYYLRHESWICERCELYEPHPIAVLLQQLGPHLQCQTSLAAATCPRQCQERRRAQEALDLRNLWLAPDKAGELARQVIGQRVQRPERRK